jgi:hypothetical protein
LPVWPGVSPDASRDRQSKQSRGCRHQAFQKLAVFSPYGVKILEYELEGRVVILLTGRVTINAVEGHPPAAKVPLDVNNSFSIAKSNGFWIVWAYIADDPSADELQKSKPHFAGQLSQ